MSFKEFIALKALMALGVGRVKKSWKGFEGLKGIRTVKSVMRSDRFTYPPQSSQIPKKWISKP